MDILIRWMMTRISIVYGFLTNTLGLPSYIAVALTLFMIALFFYCLFDLFRYRDRGETTLIWLIIVVIVPFSSLLYLIFGFTAVRKAPIKQTSPPPQPPTSVNPRQPAYPAQYATGQPSKQKKYLGTTTVLGGVIATIALVAGIVALAFFALVVIALIQCANDPKCM
jgi:hypothetical protein